MENEKRATDWYKVVTVGLLVLSQIVALTLAYANLSNSIKENKSMIEMTKKLLEKHEGHPEYHNNMVKKADQKYMTHKDGELLSSEIVTEIRLLAQEVKNLAKKVK